MALELHRAVVIQEAGFAFVVVVDVANAANAAIVQSCWCRYHVAGNPNWIRYFGSNGATAA